MTLELVRLSQDQSLTGGAHQPLERNGEMALEMIVTVRDPEIGRIEGVNGAGLEITVIETETEGTWIEMDVAQGTGREAPAETVDMTDEVGINHYHPTLLTRRISLTSNLNTGYAARSDKFRDRSRSPARNGANTRSRSRSPPSRNDKGDRRSDRKDIRSRGDGRQANGTSGHGRSMDDMDIDFKEDADEDEMEAMMRKSMGFASFRSTKNTKVPGNEIYGVRKEKKTEYRQYMNRTGGFNRPLSPSR
ncbi:hypothetical protein N7462_010404 [Penicillium macrosclerotiorum]|uniref:uncharacterized protein n=1 Tax=Penicillium macrosclerotiorum TaxID=303699 RepID=UPI002547B85C|nr:uncharacterized protein N7462_010404 [Penicillium macrosclerotiorum]KAJ5669334.1 hypothetical protein N7462_010404 [Penicillium macrosclerotiorum]